jgi:hypothetical protein
MVKEKKNWTEELANKISPRQFSTSGTYKFDNLQLLHFVVFEIVDKSAFGNFTIEILNFDKLSLYQKFQLIPSGT